MVRREARASGRARARVSVKWQGWRNGLEVVGEGELSAKG